MPLQAVRSLAACGTVYLCRVLDAAFKLMRLLRDGNGAPVIEDAESSYATIATVDIPE